MGTNRIGQRILYLSNGHGEDVIYGQIIKALKHKYSDLEVIALPIVGNGDTYRKLEVKIISPVRNMPSGGIFYMNPLCLLQDLWAGLIDLTYQQIQALRIHARECDLILATGDIVPLAIAYYQI